MSNSQNYTEEKHNWINHRRHYMKNRITQIDKVNGWYIANGVPLDYDYWTEESEKPCPECGSKLIFDDEIWSGNEYCPYCNKYLYPKCNCGECSGDNRQNRPIALPEFRQKIQSLEKQDSDHLEWMQGWADNAWVANLLNRIEVFERYKYLSPSDQSLIAKQSSEIEQVLQLLGEGKNELPSLLYFKAAMKIIIAELKDSSDREIYNSFIGKIDTLVQNKNYLEDADYYGVFEYQKFYEKIAKFYYPDEIEDPDDRFDSIYSAQVEAEEGELNQKLEDGWDSRMKEIRSKISEILSAGGEVAGLLEAHISLSDVDEFIGHLLEQQKKLDSEIFRYEFMKDDQEA